MVSGTNCIIQGKQQDPFCRNFNEGGVCIACYTGYFYNQALAKCHPFNTLCKTSNLADGSCTSCFPGYTLANGNCQVAFQDPNCQSFDQSKGTCSACSNSFYLGSDGKCRQVNPLCKTSDKNTGACLSCYPGYVLQAAQCLQGGNSTMDVNCQSFDTGVCVKCSNGYYLNPGSKMCTQLDPLCKTSSTSTGACLTCYPGYMLAGGSCVLGSGSAGNGDPNCKSTNAYGVCTDCYSSYYLSVQATCLRLDPQCKTYTAAKSACASCFAGYTLTNGQCAIAASETTTNSDPYCIKSQGALCLQCANGYYLHPDGLCHQLNPLCKTSNMTNGNCIDCYQGYTLSTNTCVEAAAVYIPNCAIVNGISCAECINGYYVSNGGCSAVSILCANYDKQTGACFSCVPGYVFQKGDCIQPALGVDPYCSLYSGPYCSTCMQGYALVNYVCTYTDVNCLEFDATRNQCNKCKNGKTPNGPNCV
jgi:hypothetical protein